jgi:phage terminase large subunit-like protein
MERDIVDLDDACDWLTGFMLRQPDAKAAILVKSTVHENKYVDRLFLNGIDIWHQTQPDRKILYPNGSIATFYTMSAPERLRGPQFHAALVEDRTYVGESMTNLETQWEAVDNLEMCVRLGDRPRLRYVRS